MIATRLTILTIFTFCLVADATAQDLSRCGFFSAENGEEVTIVQTVEDMDDSYAQLASADYRVCNSSGSTGALSLQWGNAKQESATVDIQQSNCSDFLLVTDLSIKADAGEVLHGRYCKLHR